MSITKIEVQGSSATFIYERNSADVEKVISKVGKERNEYLRTYNGENITLTVLPVNAETAKELLNAFEQAHLITDKTKQQVLDAMQSLNASTSVSDALIRRSQGIAGADDALAQARQLGTRTITIK